MVFRLRIKRIFYEQILAGHKVKEYRSVKPHYAGLDRPGLTHIKLDYQGPCSLLCKIIQIKKIRRPRFLTESGIEFTAWVFEITIKPIRETWKEFPREAI